MPQLKTALSFLSAQAEELKNIRAFLVDLPYPLQRGVEAAAQEARAIARQYGDCGLAAVSLVAAEIAAGELTSYDMTDAQPSLFN